MELSSVWKELVALLRTLPGRVPYSVQLAAKHVRWHASLVILGGWRGVAAGDLFGALHAILGTADRHNQCLLAFQPGVWGGHAAKERRIIQQLQLASS